MDQWLRFCQSNFQSRIRGTKWLCKHALSKVKHTTIIIHLWLIMETSHTNIVSNVHLQMICICKFDDHHLHNCTAKHFFVSWVHNWATGQHITLTTELPFSASHPFRSNWLNNCLITGTYMCNSYALMQMHTQDIKKNTEQMSELNVYWFEYSPTLFVH